MQKSHAINEEEFIGTRKALVISVSDYDKPSNLQSLDFCRNDGDEMYELLKSLGYKIEDNHKLIGQVKFDTIRDAIYDFFDNAHTKAEDTLVFYYSGHGVPSPDGDMCLASSEINPDDPYRRGFSSSELTRLIQNSVSIRIVTILDCCYSGAAKISKGYEQSAAQKGTDAIQDKARMLQQGEGKCLLAASQAAQEAYGLKAQDHSIFTYYLLEGLRGNKKSVDIGGNVTPYSLGNYVYKAILNLPDKKRPKQKPITKTEASGEIILAHYPDLAEKPVVDIAPLIFEGNKYINNENYSKAIELYDEAIKLNPKSHFAHVYKGNALLKLKKYDEAIKCYDAALEINSKEIDALKYKGLSLSNLSKYNEAIQCYDAVLEIDPIDSKVWYYKGSALSQLSKYSEAIKCYNEAIKINPEYSDALRDKELLEKFAKAGVVEQKPAPLPRADISLILDEGTQYFENGDYDNAIKSFDKAVLLNPKNPIPYNYKGDVFFKLKKYEEAIKSYDAALEINPKYLDVLKDKGLALDNLGKYQEAINCFDAALEINPKIARNWYYKALSLSKLPNNEEAIRCYDEALRLEPNNVDAWIGKGVCLGILNRYKEALECYDKAIAIDANNIVAHDKKKVVLQIISEEIKLSPQQQQSPVITPISSSSSAIKEEHHPHPTAIKEKKKHSWINPKILIPIVAVVIGATLAFTVFGGVLPPSKEGYSFVRAWGSEGTENGQFKEPLGVAVDSQNNVYVSDSNNHRIQKFTADGTFITKWGSQGTENGQFNGPEGIAVDSQNNVYVSDASAFSGSDHIQKFTADGTFITKWGFRGTENGRFMAPVGTAIDSENNVYVADSGNNLIQKFTADGTFITKWGFWGTENGQFKTPSSVAVDSQNNVYVADSGNNRIQKFDSDGKYIAGWGSKGTGEGQFIAADRVAIDSSSNVYVADWSNDNIQKFTADGTFITKWGSPGTENGQFNSPSGVAVDSQNNVYVADYDNDRIQVFAPPSN
jgi:tetratricopeptide (TPR) repeat protein/sugar lactone lactonase YvrE